MVSSADALVKQIDGVFSGGEQGPQFAPSVSQCKPFFVTSAPLSPVTRSTSASGRRLISSAQGWGLSIIVPKTFWPLFMACVMAFLNFSWLWEWQATVACATVSLNTPAAWNHL